MNSRYLAATLVVVAITVGGLSLVQAATPPAAAPPKLSQYRTDPAAPGQGGPNFTGPAKVTGRFPLHGASRLRTVSAVSFEPGGRTRWHSHPFGQLLVVTHGRGWVQAEGEAVRVMRVGDMIWTAPGVLHWHGSTRTTGVTHAAISEQVEGVEVDWRHAVSESEYRGPR